jgi:hypothetical protein
MAGEGTVSERFRTAIQWIREGRWDEAHELVQSSSDPLACWIHAWLHRQEGDDGNAGYWYRRAGRSFPDLTLDDELDLIAETLDETNRG